MIYFLIHTDLPSRIIHSVTIISILNAIFTSTERIHIEGNVHYITSF
jgi:hypothetical protein